MLLEPESFGGPCPFGGGRSGPLSRMTFIRWSINRFKCPAEPYI